jgi:hypothetical protein
MTITDDFEVFADNYHKQNGTHNPLKVPYIKVKETNDKLIYYDKKNDKFIWEFKLNLAHLPQDIEEDIGRMITSHQLRNKVLKIKTESYKWIGEPPYESPYTKRVSKLLRSAIYQVKLKRPEQVYACNYPQKNGKLCGCMSQMVYEKIPDKYRGGQRDAFRTMGLRHGNPPEFGDMLNVSLCGKHMKVKDFSWDKYFEANGYKFRNGVMCKVCKD